MIIHHCIVIVVACRILPLTLYGKKTGNIKNIVPRSTRLNQDKINSGLLSSGVLSSGELSSGELFKWGFVLDSSYPPEYIHTGIQLIINLFICLTIKF